MLRALFWKDVRINRLPLLVGVVLLIGPYFLAVGVGTFSPPTGSAGTSAMWGGILALGSIYSLGCSQLTLAVLAGNVIAVDASRVERLLGEKAVSWEVRRKGNPGLSIDRQSRTYSRTKAAKEHAFPLPLLTAMEDVPPEKVEDLGKKRIGKVDARGFRTSLRNLSPDTGAEGTLSVWIDQDSRLPLLVVQEDQLHTVRIEGFKWNISVKPELFDVQPPDDYEDKTPAPPNDKELAQIIGAFKTYSAAYGHYPQVEKIQGDVTSAGLRKKLGIPAGEFGQAVVEHKEFPRWLDASYGWGWMNVLHNQNSDCRYFGKTVGPKDAVKVLTHWKLEDESYRVIYGDLKTETVTAAKLHSLLEKK